MICNSRRNGRISRWLRRVISCPATRMEPLVGSINLRMARPTVDFPQPDSPTRPSVSPSPIEKLTPSTASHRIGCAAEKSALDGKMLLQRLDLEHGVRRSDTQLVRGEGKCQSRSCSLQGPGCQHAAQWPARFAHRQACRRGTVVGARATRREGASGGSFGQRRHHAGNLRNRFAAAASPRNSPSRAATSAGRAYTGAAGRRTKPPPSPPPPCGRIHHDDALRGLGDEPESCVIRMTAVPSFCCRSRISSRSAPAR